MSKVDDQVPQLDSFAEFDPHDKAGTSEVRVGDEGVLMEVDDDDDGVDDSRSSSVDALDEIEAGLNREGAKS